MHVAKKLISEKLQSVYKILAYLLWAISLNERVALTYTNDLEQSKTCIPGSIIKFCFVFLSNI